ncbi:MAG: hypothetical protein GY719_40945 [bacterium]|nr:hypothetical protein [bacterium]
MSKKASIRALTDQMLHRSTREDVESIRRLSADQELAAKSGVELINEQRR